MYRLSALLALGFLIGVAPAPAAPPAAPPRMHALQVSPFGLVFGHYAADYELLLGRRHGLWVGGMIADGKDLGGNRQDGHSLGASYRYHLADGLVSSFVGVFVRQGEITGDMKIEDERFGYRMEMLAIGPVYGERHRWRRGISFSWRLGYGYPVFEFEWSGERPDHHRLIRGIMKWTANLESGFSIGMTF